MKKHEVTQVLAVLSTVWSERTITPETSQAYFWALEDEPAELVQAAVREWMKREKWFPKPSELIHLAHEIGREEYANGVATLLQVKRPLTAEEFAQIERLAPLAKVLGTYMHPAVRERIGEVYALQASQERGIA